MTQSTNQDELRTQLSQLMVDGAVTIGADFNFMGNLESLIQSELTKRQLEMLDRLQDNKKTVSIFTTFGATKNIHAVPVEAIESERNKLRGSK